MFTSVAPATALRNQESLATQLLHVFEADQRSSRTCFQRDLRQESSFDDTSDGVHASAADR